MEQERSASPEKQLLKLIEGSKSAQDKPSGGVSIRSNSMSLFSMHAWLGRFSYFKEKLHKWANGESLQSDIIKVTNRALMLSIFFMAAYLVLSVSVHLASLRKAPIIKMKLASPSDSSGAAAEDLLLKSSAYYLERVRSRDIFKMGPPASAVVQQEEDSSGKLAEMAKDLRLVGISWSDDPDAMIEDVGKLKTYFVKRGQAIGELKVRAIFKDKVVLSYGSQEIDLK